MASSVTRRDDAVVWTAFEIADKTADAILAALRTSETAQGAPDIPWAALHRRADGSTVAAVSPGFLGGLYWTRSGTDLIIGDHVADVVTAANVSHLDPQFVTDYALLHPAPDSSPYSGVYRIPEGTSRIFGSPDRIVAWFDFAAARSPRDDDVVTRYREVFGRALAAVTPDDGPLVCTVSGGLDSTMVAATLAMQQQRLVRGLCHSPLAAARPVASQNFEPDDYPVAKLLEASHPGRIVIEQVLAEESDHPLDAARQGARDQWLPVFNPGNQIWMYRMSEIAARSGADRLFMGIFGNASFSYDHRYAPAYHAVRGQFPSAAHALTGGRSTPTARMVLGAVRRQIRRSTPSPGLIYRDCIGLGSLPDKKSWRLTRDSYLQFLTPTAWLQGALSAASWPAAAVDPFRSRELIELAASIAPVDWRLGGSRGLARRVGEDRVPDGIRLRRARGGQATDTWYLMRNSRDRYFDQVQMIGQTEVLAALVDQPRLRRTLEGWQWGQIEAPDRVEVTAVNRLFSLAEFVRMSTERLGRQHAQRHSTVVTVGQSLVVRA